MLSASEYQFANCRVSSQAREVWLDGVLQEVPPRVFDLLLYLLKHHDRVVSKEEILEEIWLGRVVTDNVVSRAIMIARSVIGDSKSNPVLIKTVQRVGYRFIGALQQDEMQRGKALSALPQLVRTRVVRLALLPFENNTGDDQLAWVELGLPTLVNQAMRQDDRVEVLTATAVLAVLDDRPPDLSSEETAQYVLRVLGASCLIQTWVTRVGADYVLVYRAYGEHAKGVAGNLQGVELTALAQNLARLLARSLFSEDVSMVPFESTEPFVNECFARAMQALDQQHPAKALDLMRVVKRLEPESSAVALVYLRALSEVGHEDTFKVAEQLIERGRTSYDSYLENSARKILATALWHDRYDFEAADRVLDRVFAANPPNPMQDWYVDALLTRARIRVDMGDIAVARDIITQVFALSDQIKNQMLRVQAMNLRAVNEAKDGNFWQAREGFKEVCALFKNHEKPLGYVLARSYVGTTNYYLGLLDEAVNEAAETMTLLSGFAIAPQKYANTIITAAMIFAHAHETQHLENLTRSLAEGLWTEVDADDDVVLNMVRGYYSYATGDPEGAADMFVASISSAQSGKRVYSMTNVPIAAFHLSAAGRFDDAQRVRAMLDPSAASLFPWIPSFMLHTQAIEASLSGDTAGAHRLLCAALEQAAGGFGEALTRIDLAWIYIYMGDFEAARELCRPIGPWLSQHPAGMIVLAALEFNAGRPDEVSRAMQTHYNKVGGVRRSRFAGLLEILMAAAGAQRPADLTTFCQLPTTYLLQRHHRVPHTVTTRTQQAHRSDSHETSLER